MAAQAFLAGACWRLRARLRMRLGAAILGDGWLGVMAAHMIIAQRARDCITPDGQVILAKCQPLADALYAQIPGIWTFTAQRAEDSPTGASVLVVDPSRSTPDALTVAALRPLQGAP